MFKDGEHKFNVHEYKINRVFGKINRVYGKKIGGRCEPSTYFNIYSNPYFLFRARSIATATDTVAPTIGLLPMPRNPIISTCAGTEEDPAN